ncbi:hypothetical protein [Streptomyces sp. I6]|uniref:hypothetical protein n=1 Tax=Streptomyces sp. I6 TaxID=2483113 RepID=UPI000F458AEB|nr:hypothetical protein [Streptomyces sp. I6]RNL73648.1 hypothetical protein EBF04_27615 [Streptomyces sp. I6]
MLRDVGKDTPGRVARRPGALMPAGVLMLSVGGADTRGGLPDPAAPVVVPVAAPAPVVVPSSGA